MRPASSATELTSAFDGSPPAGRPGPVFGFLGALGVFESGAPFHPTELSVSLSPGGAPRKRALSQLRRSAGMPAADVLERAVRAFEWFSPRGALPVFHQIFGAVYGASAQRFGLGVEVREGRPAGLRAYFDLFSRGPERASLVRREALRLVGLDDPIPSTKVRVLGVDMDDRGVVATKLYFAADRHFPVPRSTLCGLSLPRGSIKVDLYLPDRFATDAGAAGAVESLLAGLDIDPHPYRETLALMLDGAPLGECAGVHQYLSLDPGRAKVNVSFRPGAFGADWLPVRGRPGPAPITPPPQGACSAPGAGEPPSS